MPDSEELDNILNELREKNEKEDKSEPAFTLNEPEEKPTAEEPVEELEPEIVEEKPEKIEEADESIDSHIDSFNVQKEEKKPMPDKKEKAPKSKKNKIPFLAAICILAIVIIVCIFVMVNKGVESEETTTAPTVTQAVSEEVTAAPLPTTNPLTGEDDFREKAVGKRPVACVVENAQAARPQWGINDSTNPPDIIVEGEVEGGETRMLWLYADYKSLPSQIGPMRSARPPYIKFSELFDAIFVHWGMSKTKKGTSYIGANTVFRKDNVDHINQMTFSGVALFGRDGSRGVSTEHTGVLYGDKLAEAIKHEGFRTKAKQDHYTKFNFGDDVQLANPASSLALTFSKRTHTRDWSYNESDKMYHSNDYATDVARKNLLVLFDTTEYVAKENYKNSYTEVYCNYGLAGGKGTLCTNGTSQDITWAVENGVLAVKDSDGNAVTLNKGTTWIGYASSNNGGSVTVK